MSKLKRKFLLSFALVLAAVFVVFIVVNSRFVKRYLLYSEKQDMNRICKLIQTADDSLETTIEHLEAVEDILIVAVSYHQDNSILNDRLRSAMTEKGIGFQKYWLWEQDQQDAVQTGQTMRLYQQERLHYSLLVEYLYLGDHFVAAAKIIPAADETIAVMNRVIILVSAVSGLVILGLVSVLVNRITVPLASIGDTARAIAALDFKQVKVKTGDELELLAADISDMSRRIKNANDELADKNRQMEELLAGVSHDLKTPVALINAYAHGINDGLDDGTFLATILAQTKRMEQLIAQLLQLEKVKQQKKQITQVNLEQTIRAVVADYQIAAKARDLEFELRIESGRSIQGNQETMELIVSNLISNAVKYADQGRIVVILKDTGSELHLLVKNHVKDSRVISVDKLWDPFYVAEASRNKHLTGTGLGLSMVQAAAKRYGYRCHASINNNEITFCICFCQTDVT